MTANLKSTLVTFLFFALLFLLAFSVDAQPRYRKKAAVSQLTGKFRCKEATRTAALKKYRKEVKNRKSR